MDAFLGNYIDGAWLVPDAGTPFRSVDPATAGDVVFEGISAPQHAALAVRAAAAAWEDWARASSDERVEALRRFAKALERRIEPMAQAATREMGKVLRESRAEARSLLDRIELVAREQLPRVAPWEAPGVDGECRYHPLGVIAVIGPFNFPLHLVHAHVIPALATGNTVVIKPSERCPLTAQRYVEAFAEAGLPPVLQLVQGNAAVGRALIEAPELRGVAFTGSWPTGHAIQRALLERPEVLVALEMGGQNMAIVLDDADLDQALEGVLLGAFLTTGQRCTGTSRVLVQRGVARAFTKRLVAAARDLSWGPPTSDVFMGPMASIGDRDRVDALCAAGVAAGAEPLLVAARRDGGAWRGPSVHRIRPDHDSAYTREEVFGPDLAVTVVEDLNEAIEVVRSSRYGLSVSLFSADGSALEEVYLRTSVGCVNWNRSTNRASGAFPFGGLGRSGNHRPAGAGAVHYTTYPVQLQWQQPGQLEGDPYVEQAIGASDPIGTLESRHRMEEECEPYGIYPEFSEDGSLRIPLNQLAQGQPDVAATLAAALVAELETWRVDAEIVDAAVVIAVPTGTLASRDVAEGLAQSLHGIRHLHPARFLGRRPPGSVVPPGPALSLPRSQAFLERLCQGDFMPDDKKPPVIDVYRSSGPYLASIDDEPLVLFDAAGQIATHAGGMNAPEVLETLWNGGFSDRPLANPDTRKAGTPELSALGATLRRGAGDQLPWVAFCGSGAEANEIALRIASRRRPGRRAVVAFDGAFHGRTLVALHTTWNPSKRLRFELDGYHARWAPWPTWDHTTPAPPVDLAGFDRRAPDAGRALPEDADALLRAEWESLCTVEAALADDAVVAILVEPMQSEGGERHVTARFMARLRALATAWGVPFIVDEVQTGFGLGGPFFWHRLQSLPEPPDLVTVAKKCQIGAVLSRWPLDHDGEAHLTGAIRGQVHARIMSDGGASRCEHDVKARLAKLREAHPTTVLAPRATGWAFGFDLPTPEAVEHLIAQRLWRGWMLYGAGSHALRFRLHPHVDAQALDGLFDRLDQSLSLLESGEPPTWRADAASDLARPWPPRPADCPPGYRIVAVARADWPRIRPAAEALQAVSYEPARRDNLDLFGALIAQPGAIALIAYFDGDGQEAGAVVGTALAFPLEHVAHLDGPAQDPMLGRGNTLYSADVTVHPGHRGTGLGAALKEAQIVAAMTASRPNGSARYAFITGRNRVGATDAIMGINARYGAFTVARYTAQYGETDGVAVYYRLPLTAPHLPTVAFQPRPVTSGVLDLDFGLSLPLGTVEHDGPGMDELTGPYRRGVMNGAVVNKLSLCNFVTPAVVRSVEMLRAVAPRSMQHLVLASSRAETCDKGLRAFKYHRGAASIVISVGPVWGGETTAAARALGRPADDPENWFGWPRTADPTLAPEQALDDLRDLIAREGAERILTVVIEPVFARTARAVPEDFWAPLRELTREAGIPLTLLETSTGGYRSGRGVWRADTLPVTADAVWYFAGGQLGLCYLGNPWYVAEKLTLISTWDGDEASLIRFCWRLRAARALPIARTASRLRELFERLGPVDGEGLMLSVDRPDASELRASLAWEGVRVGLTERGALRLRPPLNLDESELDVLEAAIDEVLA
jgi:acyl-CoA reductase-like NAD-dependent aldehyde dehydrogenase/4-aminobutyrate aminotransferase-like enzyme/GNAT superfamily N-acetyltransferase